MEDAINPQEESQQEIPQVETPEQENVQEETPQEEELFGARTELQAFRKAVDQIKAEIGKVIVGQHKMVELMIAAILADGHVLIEGVPGVAKTLSAKLLAKSLEIPFSRIQFTPDLMPSDVIGTSVFNPQTTQFEFKEGPIFSQVVLIDEINRAPAKTQAALFEVMEERQITTDGFSRKMELPFIVIATQNPIEQEGTYRLPEAQLDRFIFKISVDYPNPDEELKILEGHHGRKGQQETNMVNAVMPKEEIKAYQQIVREIRVEEKLLKYIVDIIQKTRNSNEIFLGASPRATIGILATAKAIAAIRGRDFVTPEDIKFVATPVLQHRIILTPEREMEGGSPEDAIKNILEQVEVPR
ncbi:MAG: MoxR family ATPase [Bacteroidia bacterium]|nr:MoxR family ATPase [Bacteroidia bacterium]